MDQWTDLHLARQPREAYRDVRPRLHTGDLLFVAGDSMLSDIIQNFTDSVWSHCGMIVVVPAPVDRVLVLESVAEGVRLAPLSVYVKAQKVKDVMRGVAIGRHKLVSSFSVTQMCQRGLDLLTKPYDRDELLRIAWRITRGQGRSKPDEEYICSELVDECYRAGGITLEHDDRGFIAPETVWQQPEVELVALLQAEAA